MRKLLLVGALALVSCIALTPTQRAILTSATTFAQVAVQAAATVYGGPAAGELASVGLQGLAEVLKAYVGQPIPAKVVAASPGVKAVGPAVAPLISPTHAVTEADSALVTRAAEIALTLDAAETPKGK